MRTMCSREIFTKKCRQQQNFDSDPKEAWHYNHVTFTPIAKNFMLYCRLIYLLSMLYVRLTIKVKVGIPESFKVGWYPHKITGSSHLEVRFSAKMLIISIKQIITIPFYLVIYHCLTNDLNLILKLQPKFPRARVKQSRCKFAIFAYYHKQSYT